MSDELPDDWRHVRNIGPVTLSQLRAIGIHTPAELFDLGAADVYVRLKRAYPGRVTRTMLWALAGAELDIDWRQLPHEVKTRLIHEVSHAHDEVDQSNCSTPRPVMRPARRSS